MAEYKALTARIGGERVNVTNQHIKCHLVQKLQTELVAFLPSSGRDHR